MNIKDLSNFYIGQTAGTAIYVGSTKVWPVEAGLLNYNLLYKSSSNAKLTPTKPARCNATIATNTYSNGLGTITFNGELTSIDGAISAANGFWYDESRLTWVQLPDTLVTLGNWSFRQTDKLGEVILGKRLKTIGKECFYNCTNLKTIHIQSPIESIGTQCFYRSSGSITSLYVDKLEYFCGITFGDMNANPLRYGANLYVNNQLITDLIYPNLSKINDYAFYMSKLTSVTIPDSVETIGNYAFTDCSSLTSVYCKATTPPALGTNVFSGNASDRKIYVPTESVDTYKAATGWSNYSSSIIGYNFE